MKKIAFSFVQISIIFGLLSGCNQVKMEMPSFLESESKPVDYKTVKLTLDPAKDIVAYKQVGYPFAELPKLEGYLNGLLAVIIDKNELQTAFVNQKPKIKVSVSSSFNASTFRNGLIVINTGMLYQLKDENELRAVIAHELVHLLNGHHQKDELNSVADKAMQVAMLQAQSSFAGASEAELLKGLPELLGKQLFEDTINAIVFTKWNREQEMEADTAALGLLKKAGFKERNAMVGFLQKRLSFEQNNPEIFAEQNNEKMVVVDMFTQAFAGLAPKEEMVAKEPEAVKEESITAKYYSAQARIDEVETVIMATKVASKANKTTEPVVLSQVEKKSKSNDKKKARNGSLKKVMPGYSKLKKIYELNDIEGLIAKRYYTKASKKLGSLMHGSLATNSYFILSLAKINEARGRTKTAASLYRKALKDKNITLVVYEKIIEYYDKKGNKKELLALLDRMNQELDYPNSYLPIAINLKKKYAASTKMEEAQCMRTVDVGIIDGCQKALGRGLKVNSGDLLQAVSAS